MANNVYTHGLSMSTAAAKSSHGKRKLSQTTRDDFDSDDNNLNPTRQKRGCIKGQRDKRLRRRQDKQEKAASDTEDVVLMADGVTPPTQGIQQPNSGMGPSDLAASALSTHLNPSQEAPVANADIIEISSDGDERAAIGKTPARGVATDDPDQTLQKQPQIVVSPFDEPQASSFVTLGCSASKSHAAPAKALSHKPDHLTHPQATPPTFRSSQGYVTDQIFRVDDADVSSRFRQRQQVQLAAPSASRGQPPGVAQVGIPAVTSQAVVPARTNAGIAPAATARAVRPVAAVDKTMSKVFPIPRFPPPGWKPPTYLSCYEVCLWWPNSLHGEGMDPFLHHHFTAAQIFLCLSELARTHYRLRLPESILSTLQRFLTQRKAALQRAQTYDALMTGPEIRRDGRWDDLKISRCPPEIINGTTPVPPCPPGFEWRTVPPTTAASTAITSTESPHQNDSDSVDDDEAVTGGDYEVSNAGMNEDDGLLSRGLQCELPMYTRVHERPQEVEMPRILRMLRHEAALTDEIGFLQGEVDGIRGDLEDIKYESQAEIKSLQNQNRELKVENEALYCEAEGETNRRLDAQEKADKAEERAEHAEERIESAEDRAEDAEERAEIAEGKVTKLEQELQALRAKT